MTEYTEGVCADGAAILRDGVPITISEILATLNQASVAEWHPIETAPESTRVLVACAQGDVMIAVHGEYIGWMRDDSGGTIFDRVTHWAPIPPPPEPEQ